MSEAVQEINQRRPLERSFDLSQVTWWSMAATAVVIVSSALRLARLDWLALSPAEASRAFDALILFEGRPLAEGQSLPDTSPLFLLLQVLSYLLFGVSDATARLAPALAGTGIVLLALALHPYIGRLPALTMALFAGLSPILLFSSRTADPDILIAFFALLALVAFLRVGDAADDRTRQLIWCGVLGLGLAAMFASGPVALSVLLTMLVGFGAALFGESGRTGAIRPAATAILKRPANILTVIVVFVVVTVFVFSRALTSVSALRGVGDTVVDWVRYLADDPSSTPTQFFLLAILLYEIAALLCAIAGFALLDDQRERGLSWLFFLGWFVAALVLFSFSSGRGPDQAVHVALPLVLWGGGSAGALIAGLNWRSGWAARNVLTIAAFAALIAAFVAFIASLMHIGDASDETQAVFETISIAVIAVAPLALAVFSLTRGYVGVSTGRSWRAPAYALVLALLVFLGAYTVRSTILLSFERAAESTELAAQRTSTNAVPAVVQRIENLSRDLTVAEGSTQDPTGGHSLSIAIDNQVEWPFRWYFRDFPFASTVPEGTAPVSGADVVIASESTGMDQAGYAHRSYPVLNRVPPAYLTPSVADVLRSIVTPSRWNDGLRFLLFRESMVTPDPEPISVGYGSRVASQLFPSSGPYSLSDRPGAGSGRGQFREPRGIAVSPVNGTVFVVDMSNGRVERFDASGAFVGSWGADEGNVTFEVTPDGLGPTGIALGPDGLVYVADTWGHRIVVLNQSGQVVRQFGAFGDTFDSPDPTIEPGMFFGPRAVAVTEDEIYVVDTGNERVQVFAPDGTFLRAWGGYGSEPSQLIEPVGIAIDSEGRVYVADSGNARISVFARTGTPLEQWPVPAWQGNLFFEPYLAIDPSGRLYATSSATGSVEVFDRTGQQIDSITNVGNEFLEGPIGIASAADGTIFISDADRSAVLRYTPPPAPVEVVDDLGASPAASPEASPAASPQASPVASPLASPPASPQAVP